MFKKQVLGVIHLLSIKPESILCVGRRYGGCCSSAHLSLAEGEADGIIERKDELLISLTP